MSELTRDRITPSDADHWHAMRAEDITSTDCAALFHHSPYQSYFDLWHAKRSGIRQPFVENERMRRGRQIESAIADMYADEVGANVQPFRDYMRIPEYRLGASFDFVADAGGHAPPWIVECKNVDFRVFKGGWSVTDDFIEAPAHIEIQVQHQMLVAGIARAVIVALVGGNDLRILSRSADRVIQDEIIRRAREFWQSIGDDRAPDPVYPGDAESVIRQYSFAEPGRVADLRNDEAACDLFGQYEAARKRAADADALKDELKARLLTVIGDSERAIFKTGTVSCGMVAPSPGTLITAEMVGTHVGARSGYRLFRANPKK